MKKKKEFTIKPSYLVSAAIVIAAIFIASPAEEEQPADTGSYTAYLESFSGDTVVAESASGTRTWKTDDDTTYTYVVGGRESVTAEEAADLTVTVTDSAAFEQYLKDYESETRLPLSFEVENGRIISIKALPVS